MSAHNGDQQRSVNKDQVIEISSEDLPLCCPRPHDALWNKHPRVYLPIDQSSEETCPYCGAQYRLVK